MNRTFIQLTIAYLLLALSYSQTGRAAVLVKDKMWPQNMVLNVVFLDGSAQQIDLVKNIAPLWVENTSLKLRFISKIDSKSIDTHIRISFSSHTGSMLGDHGDYAGTTPTLLLNRLSQEQLAPELAKRYVLHEFGHALGFEHEYRNPTWPFGNAPIQKHIENCIPRMKQLGYLGQKATIKCREINQPLPSQKINATIYDQHSIMNYPQVVVLEDNTEKLILAKSELSALDKLAMERWYGLQQ
ncbi:hypothetical protein [Aliikangiella coralliicola]|uniref:Peptidase metallopeptidase domain-containing protein n=1 Tax=Aliikangiella coralliicola TaxID=2592383 RepID=A0A545UGQ4_9GAMM|nr:hypothetical protein [Aliikangiella coralliicola]TQV88656.1 hypothetical protein FLL46_09070 [Aliikangiella coralliicola]